MRDPERSFHFQLLRGIYVVAVKGSCMVFCVAEPYLCVHVALCYFCILYSAVALQAVPAIVSPILKQLYCVQTCVA